MTAAPKQSAVKTSSQAPRDAIALLKEDYAKVGKMFVQFAASKDVSERHELARQICRELRVHTAIEDDPAARIRETEPLEI